MNMEIHSPLLPNSEKRIWPNKTNQTKPQQNQTKPQQNQNQKQGCYLDLDLNKTNGYLSLNSLLLLLDSWTQAFWNFWNSRMGNLLIWRKGREKE